IYKLRANHKSEGPQRKQKAAAFRQKYGCVDKHPDVIAVFDTVRALGVPILTDAFGLIRHAFQDNYLSEKVKCGLHALAIDENRKQFLPELWATDREDGSRHLEQVWFPGVHSDIGGGYGDDRRLADAALTWMCSRLKSVCELDLGVDTNFDQAKLLGTAHNERTGLGVFWLHGDRTWDGNPESANSRLVTLTAENSLLCQQIEHRYTSMKSYRPKATQKHMRVKSFY
ncbi:MAG: phospholipase effector Tle1 domain-containing protein, partial [Rhizobiaceae bacterium]